MEFVQHEGQQERVDPGLSDLEVAWRTDPEAFVALRDGDVLAGGGSIFSYGGDFGFMGLFIMRADLRKQGLAIVFITHFLDQVFAIADRVTILRNGKLVETRPLNELSRTDVVRKMLGKDIAFSGATTVEVERPETEVLVQYEGYGRKRSIQPFSLTIHKGEVIGVAVAIVAIYLFLNLVVILIGLGYIVGHPGLLSGWWADVTAGDWYIRGVEHLPVQGHDAWAIAAVCFLFFPKLALGLSGFETGVAVMPLVRGGAPAPGGIGRLPRRGARTAGRRPAALRRHPGARATGRRAGAPLRAARPGTRGRTGSARPRRASSR